MNLFGMLELSGSALGAERQRAEVVASNMANAQTTRTPAGGPYRRQLVVFQAQRVPRFSLALAGLEREHSSAVRVAAVVPDQRPPVMRFEPGIPTRTSKATWPTCASFSTAAWFPPSISPSSSSSSASPKKPT